MRMQAVIVLAACLAVAADSAPKEAGKKDLEDIQGTWVAIATEANGAKSEEAKNLKLVIKENKITFNTGARQRESTFELDPTKKPKVIVITPLDGRHAGQALRGLYAFEKGMLRLCVNNEKDQSPTVRHSPRRRAANPDLQPRSDVTRRDRAGWVMGG